MRYRITHRTAYSYSSQVALCQNEAHLTPRSCNMQTVLQHKLLISPQTAAYSERIDFFGNHVAYFAVQQPHTELVVTAISEVELDTDNGQLHFQSNACWEEAVNSIGDQLTPANLEARQYLLDSPMVKASQDIADYAAVSFPRQRPLVESVRDLMERIHADFTYDPGFTEIATPLQHVFEHRRGVCQDFAHLAIACLRSQGLAALHIRLSRDATTPRTGEAAGRRRVSCLVRRVRSGRGLARLRSDQQQNPHAPAHHHRLGPGLR